jgi:hypothetical protein
MTGSDHGMIFIIIEGKLVQCHFVRLEYYMQSPEIEPEGVCVCVCVVRSKCLAT